MKRIYKISIFTAVVALSFAGCKKEFLEKKNPNAISSQNYWKTASDAERGVNAVYASLQYIGFYMRLYHMATDMVSDETRGTGTLNTSWVQLKLFTANANNELPKELWIGCYQGISRANLVLENVPAISMDADLQNRILGEARFLRAFYYWHLVANFGDVPLITKVGQLADPDEVKFPARTPKLQVYNQMIEDLQFAAANLDPSYDAANLGRATSWAAKSLLGKVYLYMASDDPANATTHYTDAATILTDVINNGPYDLVADYRDNHTSTNENNIESVFEVQFASGFGSVWAGTDQPTSGEGQLRSVEFGVLNHGFHNVIPSEKMVKEFEPGDPRKGLAMYGDDAVSGNITFGTQKYFNEDAANPGIFQQAAGWNGTSYSDYYGGFAIRKYSHDGIGFEETNTGSEINIRAIRFADVLLMRAEAANESGSNGGTAQAAADVNRVRARASASLPTVSASLSKDDMRDSIIHERMVELCFEEHRLNDLRRWHKLGYVDFAEEMKYTDNNGNVVKPEMPKYLYYPIPALERDINSNLSQNTGW